MKTTTLIASCLLALTSVAAHAGDRHDRDDRHDRGFSHNERLERTIDQRQFRLQRRTWAGLENGELTRYEAHSLMHEQRAIQRLERRFLADGRLSPREFSVLDRCLDQVSRDIRRERHDHQAQNDYYGHGYFR